MPVIGDLMHAWIVKLVILIRWDASNSSLMVISRHHSIIIFQTQPLNMWKQNHILLILLPITFILCLLIFDLCQLKRCHSIFSAVNLNAVINSLGNFLHSKGKNEASSIPGILGKSPLHIFYKASISFFKWSTQSWTQYSACEQTSVLWNITMPFSHLSCMPLG